MFLPGKRSKFGLSMDHLGQKCFSHHGHSSRRPPRQFCRGLDAHRVDALHLVCVPAIVVGSTAAPPWFPWQNVVSFRPNSSSSFSIQRCPRKTHIQACTFGVTLVVQEVTPLSLELVSQLEGMRPPSKERENARARCLQSSVTCFSCSFERSDRPNSSPPQPRTGRGAFSFG